eukprot:scaffold3759_cov169-Amphora_coffeaeformis.AAC.4
MAFGKRPVSWYYHNIVDSTAATTAADGSNAHFTAVFVGDDFDPTAETIVLQKQQPPNLHSYLRKKNLHRAEQKTAEQLMDLNLLVGQ